MSTVNIVMATYNGGKYIREQLESILNSTYTDWSLAVCDDNSCDNTLSIVEDYVRRYPERIFLYKNDIRRGSTANFLNGLKLLYAHATKAGNNDPASRLGHTSNRARYFMFADQDDVWLKDKIERTLARMKQVEKKYGKESPALVCTDAVVVNENLQFIKGSFISMSHLNPKRTDLPHLLMENKCMGCTVMMNCALVDYLGVLPEGIRYHDWWMALIASAFGHISYLPEQSLLYRQHGENQVGGEGFAVYCTRRIASFASQREALRLTQRQAAAFLEVYGSRLDKNRRRQLQIFAELNRRNWCTRRWQLLKYRYLKTGMIRNIGLMFSI